MKTQPINKEEIRLIQKLTRIEQIKTLAVLDYLCTHSELPTEYRQYLDRIKLQRIKDLLGGK